MRRYKIWKQEFLTNTHSAKEIVDTFYSISQEAEHFDTYVSAYSNELLLMNCVMNGDINSLETRLNQISNATIHTGYMSDNPMRQALFTLASGVTLITCFAIAGGLSEHDAYRLSDAYLQQADKASNPEQIMSLIPSALRQFTQQVHDNKTKSLKSYPVVRCVRYVQKHLHNSITLTELADYCKVTPQYLSAVFHRETGMTIMSYIRTEKLKTASQMLTLSDYSIQTISDLIAFGSPSSFCAQLKKLYGVTPVTWRTQHVSSLQLQ